MDISSVLSSSKVALERVALDNFGAVVEDFAGSKLGGGRATANNVPVKRDDGSWYATSYAAALSGGTSYRPKLKFLFKVQFQFKAEVIREFPSLANQDFTFMIKAVDRPKVDFDYEDDVNMYNFRTKVLKKIRHRELTVTFMDDTGNRVFDFFRTLMMIYSPITRRQLDRDGTTSAPSANSLNSSNGMVFTQATDTTVKDNAHRAVVNSDVGGAIECIRVKQIFVDPSASLNNAVQAVSFDFMNPRVVSFDLDDLNHETNEVNLLTMAFDYDWMEMVKMGALTGPMDPQYNIVPPGVHGAPSDISPTGGASSPAGLGLGNDIFNVIKSGVGRAGQKITSDLIGQAVKSVAGNNALGGQVSGILTNTFTFDRISNIAKKSYDSAADSVANAVIGPI